MTSPPPIRNNGELKAPNICSLLWLEHSHRCHRAHYLRLQALLTVTGIPATESKSRREHYCSRLAGSTTYGTYGYRLQRIRLHAPLHIATGQPFLHREQEPLCALLQHKAFAETESPDGDRPVAPSACNRMWTRLQPHVQARARGCNRM